MSDVADVAAVSEHLCWQLVAKVKHTLLHRHAAISLDAGVLSFFFSFAFFLSAVSALAPIDGVGEQSYYSEEEEEEGEHSCC